MSSHEVLLGNLYNERQLFQPVFMVPVTIEACAILTNRQTTQNDGVGVNRQRTYNPRNPPHTRTDAEDSAALRMCPYGIA